MPTSPVMNYDLSNKVRDWSTGFEMLRKSMPKAGSLFTPYGKPIMDNPFYYYDRLTKPISCAINNGGGYSAAETTFVVDTEVGTLKEGDQVMFKDANMEVVTVVSYTAGTHTLVTAAVSNAHDDDVEIVRVGSLNPERSTGTEGSFIDGDQRTNYLRTIRIDAKLGEISAQTKAEAFDGDRAADYMAQALLQAWDEFNMACLFGKPVAASSSVNGDTAGLFHWLNSASNECRVNGGGNKLTYDDIKNAIKNIDKASGTDPDTIIGNIDMADVVSSMNTALTNSTIFIGQDAVTAGLPGASAVYSNLPGKGAKRFLVDNNIPDGFLLIVNSSMLKFDWLANNAIAEYDAMRQDIRGFWHYIHGVMGTKIFNPYTCHTVIYNTTLT
jgi:hypothetical protein